MDFGLSGKRALVLASSRGLGLGVAREIAREGASVMLVGRDAARLDQEAASINAEGHGKAHVAVADLSKADQVETLIAAAEKAFGGGIDILVNNVGGPPAKPATAITLPELRAQFDVMVATLIGIANHFLPGMRERKWGRILTIASSGVVQPIPNLALSNALRLSLIGWSKTLAAEVAADGVTVNVIMPGRIHTERVEQIDAAAAKTQGKAVEDVARDARATIPAGRYGTVEEFAAMAAFLLSARASYVTGSMVRVDGGYIRSV